MKHLLFISLLAIGVIVPFFSAPAQETPNSASSNNPLLKSGGEMFTLPSPRDATPDVIPFLPNIDRTPPISATVDLSLIPTPPPKDVPPVDNSKTLRDASVSELEKLRLTPESELDKELPLHNDPQVTRWMVQAAMLEKESTIKKNNENTNQRLKLYEQIVLRTCAPSFAINLSVPTPLPKDSACLSVLKKIKEIHKTNPTVACLELGLQSTECSEYTAQQRTASTPIKDRDSALYRLNIGSADDGAVKNYRDLVSRVEEAVKATPLNITPIQVDSLKRYLAVTCREYGLGTEYLPSPSSEESDPAKRALLAQIDSMSGVKNAAGTVKPEVLRLVRLLPEPCFNTIATLKKNNIQLAAATCYEQGPLAPSCIQALRYERTHNYSQATSHPNATGNSQASPATKPKDGLQGF